MLRFRDSLDVRAEIAAIGTDSGGRPVAHLAFALRGATAEPQETERGSLYLVRIRFTAFDDNGEVVAWLDTTRTFLSTSRVTPDGFLVGRVTLPVPPGSLRWRLAVDQGGPRGRVFPVERLEVSSPAAPLAISDLALGAPGLSAEWTSRSGELVRLNPLGAWRSGTDLDLYAEVYGIESGAPFAVELTLTRQGGGGFLGLFGGGRKRSLTLTSSEVSRGPESPLRKTVTLTDLAPGQYRLRRLGRSRRVRTGGCARARCPRAPQERACQLAHPTCTALVAVPRSMASIHASARHVAWTWAPPRRSRR